MWTVLLLACHCLAAWTPGVQSPALNEDDVLEERPRAPAGHGDRFLQGSFTSASHGDPCSPCHCSGGRVNCSRLGLTDFSKVPQVGNASCLDLSNNFLQEIPAAAFAGFDVLKNLFLSNNNISAINETAFSGLDNLRLLDLHGNRLDVAMNVTPDLLLPMQKLQVLMLNDNSNWTSGYPDQAFAVLNSSLEELHLDASSNVSFGPGFKQLLHLEAMHLDGWIGHCDIPVLSANVFESVPLLKELSLVKCNIVYIDGETFAPLKDLETLNLSDNEHLGFRNLTIATEGLLGSKIRVLKVNFIHPPHATCVIVRKCHFMYLRLTHLEEIHVDGNNIEMIEGTALESAPPTLKHISAKYNDFSFGPYLITLGKLANLESIDLTKMGRHRTLSIHFESDIRCKDLCPPYPLIKQSVEQGREDEGSSWLPAGPIAEFQYSSHVKAPIPLPPKLRQANLQYLDMFYNLTQVNVTTNALEVLDLSYNHFSRWLGPIYGLHKLTHLNLSYNSACFIHKEFFSDLPMLEHLNISFNQLAGILAGNPISRVFEKLTALKVLDVSSNWVSEIYDDALFGLCSLEELYLSNNKLAYKHLEVDLRPLKKLAILDLSQNGLTKLPDDIMQALDDINLGRSELNRIKLDLRENPIACTCENMKFLKWINTTAVVFLRREEVICNFDNGTQGCVWNNLDQLQDVCNNNWALALGCTVAFLVATLSTLAMVAYRYRWRLRYLYYVAKATHTRVCTTEFRYDAFVSYDTDDAHFVEDKFRRRLEEQGLRVCIHRLHFMPGRSIISNIFEAVQTSRRTVCILSQNFLNSYWCQYEMQMAMEEGVQTGRDVVLLVIYDPRCKYARSLPREVLHFIRSESFIEFPNEPEYEAIFWENLIRALKE